MRTGSTFENLTVHLIEIVLKTTPCGDCLQAFFMTFCKSPRNCFLLFNLRVQVLPIKWHVKCCSTKTSNKFDHLCPFSGNLIDAGGNEITFSRGAGNSKPKLNDYSNLVSRRKYLSLAPVKSLKTGS